jgi:hypothetical protein
LTGKFALSIRFVRFIRPIFDKPLLHGIIVNKSARVCPTEGFPEFARNSKASCLMQHATSLTRDPGMKLTPEVCPCTVSGQPYRESTGADESQRELTGPGINYYFPRHSKARAGLQYRRFTPFAANMTDYDQIGLKICFPEFLWLRANGSKSSAPLRLCVDQGVSPNISKYHQISPKFKNRVSGIRGHPRLTAANRAKIKKFEAQRCTQLQLIAPNCTKVKKFNVGCSMLDVGRSRSLPKKQTGAPTNVLSWYAFNLN